MPQYYSWKLEVRVPNTVVARGGVIDRDELQETIAEKLNAFADEPITVMMLKVPDERQIEREQS